jgi:hypothetical protein
MLILRRPTRDLDRGESELRVQGEGLIAGRRGAPILTHPNYTGLLLLRLRTHSPSLAMDPAPPAMNRAPTLMDLGTPSEKIGLVHHLGGWGLRVGGGRRPHRACRLGS